MTFPGVGGDLGGRGGSHLSEELAANVVGGFVGVVPEHGLEKRPVAGVDVKVGQPSFSDSVDNPRLNQAEPAPLGRSALVQFLG